jgi:N-dimethylarginine dimethylaminohydrolase
VAYLRELGHPDAEKAAAQVERLRQRLERRSIDIHTVIIEENKTTEKDNHADSLLESEATPKQKL